MDLNHRHPGLTPGALCRLSKRSHSSELHPHKIGRNGRSRTSMSWVSRARVTLHIPASALPFKLHPDLGAPRQTRTALQRFVVFARHPDVGAKVYNVHSHTSAGLHGNISWPPYAPSRHFGVDSHARLASSSASAYVVDDRILRSQVRGLRFSIESNVS